ncbi:Predicted membrane protein [Listeria grayi]|uniref:Predicted membrane protein n=1 Tax=Listeria grayi TaxID=1641 RepID=A0A378MEE6_LISGR|nr:cell wall-active antibiotics response protein LiaF [Listeria grayi]MBC1921047.1 hypothetical protein [Listeria grayi]STY43722.1 Predicted membrane protein [Listeria grayi]VEI35015.1 Predicted membrane protein [Listeria grayi]
MKKIESSFVFIFVLAVMIGIGLEMLFRWQLLLFFAVGIFFLFMSRKINITSKQEKSYIIIAIFFLLISVLVTTTFKISLVIVGIFAIIYYINRKRAPQLLMLQTKEPGERQTGKEHFVKNQWFGNQRMLDVVYEWDDINIHTGIGDTIIDLGNTVLPTGESIIMIRSISGKIRLLVPFDLGVCIEHSAVFGHLQYEKQYMTMQNNTVKYYSDNYNDAVRKVKITTSVLFGDLEVIRL